MRAGLLQLSVGDTPEGNVPLLRDAVRRAVDGGAGFVLTPEATNCLSSSRAHQEHVLTGESADPVLALLREEAARAGIWVLAGSLILKEPGEERFTNRSILIDPSGQIIARYDKIHLFDVQVTPQDTFRESASIRPGGSAVLAQTPFAALGLTVCYDVRFPHLHRALAQAGAEVLCVPAAFNPVTGAAHWEVLLRARAIETGCYVLAPAQTGTHPATVGTPRRSYGHSLAVAPWGEVLADAGTEPGIIYADLDRAEVARARARVPSLGHDRPYALPTPLP
jgi:deaminated glutathione amidase